MTLHETKAINTCWAIFLMVFAPSKLVQQSVDHAIRSQPNMLEIEQENKLRRDFNAQFTKTVFSIRSTFFASFAVVAGAILAAFASATTLKAIGIAKSPESNAWLQYGGIGILLWGTLARVDPSTIATWDGGTLPERVDLWLYRLLYIAGSYALALSVAW